MSGDPGMANPDAEAARRLGAEGPHFADTIYQRVEIVFDWRDRLRILFGRAVDVSCSADTEFPLGRIRTLPATVHVAPIFPQKPQVMTGENVGKAHGQYADHGSIHPKK
jgi:hypothetical protein